MKNDEAVILRGVAGIYLLANPHTGFRGQAVARGLFRKQDLKPLPGDLVHYQSSQDPDIPWRISQILPRKNSLKRPALANLDKILLLASATLPEIDFHFLDRMLAYALNNDIGVSLVLTKCDQPQAQEGIANFDAYYAPSGFERYYVALDNQESLREITDSLPGKLTAFAGQSGVGKSTLMNRLFNAEILETGSLSTKAGRGKQTTRSVEIYQVGEAFLADTPGFQSLDVQNMDLEGRDLLKAYPELLAIAPHCRFADCKHLGEAGCAVAEADIAPERLHTYRRLRQDLEEQIRY